MSNENKFEKNKSSFYEKNANLRICGFRAYVGE